MFTMGFENLRFSLAATGGNLPPSVLVRGDVKTGCKNLFKKWFSALDGRARFSLLLVRYFRLPRSHKTISSCVITS